MELTLNVHSEPPEFTVITVSGEIDVYTAPKLREKLISLVEEGSYQLIADMGGSVEQSGFRGYAVPIRDQLVGDVRTPLLLLQAAVFLVLIIACVNVANLMLIRASERQRELALRVALGAGRRDLARQFVAEAMVIAFAGAVIGALIALAVIPGLVALIGNQLPAAVDGALHTPMLLVAAALAVVIGLFAGSIPALTVLRGDLLAPLNENGGRTAGSRGSARARSALVILETGLALTLLVGAGLLVKSVASLQDTHPGFSPDGVITATLALPAATYGKPEYAKTEKKSCTFCHGKIDPDKAAMAKNLNDAGTYYKTHDHKLDGYIAKK